VSMGSAKGVILSTLLQDRLKTSIFVDGGYFLFPPTPGNDQADFAPRLKIPVLMVNGRYDYSFSREVAESALCDAGDTRWRQASRGSRYAARCHGSASPTGKGGA